MIFDNDRRLDDLAVEACEEQDREPMSIIDMVKRMKFCADEITRLETERIR